MKVTLTDANYYTYRHHTWYQAGTIQQATSNYVSLFLTLTYGQGHNSRSKVTDMEVSAFSECFLLFLIITDYEVTPFFEMVKLEAGDTLTFLAPTGSSRGLFHHIGTQLNLLYLGEYVPLGYATTAPPVQTTQCTTWYCAWYG